MMQTLTGQTAGQGRKRVMTVKVRLTSSAPFCGRCRLHIGSAGFQCGACANPAPLSFRDLMRFGRLVRRHWAGTPRELWRASVLHDYRPTLITRLDPRHERRLNLTYDLNDGISERQACAERSELADLYDRIQHSRGSELRACRV